MSQETKPSPELMEEILVYIKDKNATNASQIAVSLDRKLQEVEDALNFLGNKRYTKTIANPSPFGNPYLRLTPSGLNAINDLKKYRELKSRFA